MLRNNNQMCLIALLIIIGVIIYIINSDSNKIIQNSGELNMVSHNNAEVVNFNDNYDAPNNDVDEYLDTEIESENHIQHEKKPNHTTDKAKNCNELDNMFNNCSVNGGALYNNQDFSGIEDNAGDAASVSDAYKPTLNDPNTCTDVIDFNVGDNPNTKYNSKNYLPQEINKDWFETDLSNAKHDVNNDKLINTDKFSIGINTVGQSLKNPSYDIRGTVPCPKITVSPWMQSTIEPDFNIASLY